jgi:hypothetical protein
MQALELQNDDAAPAWLATSRECLKNLSTRGGDSP